MQSACHSTIVGSGVPTVNVRVMSEKQPVSTCRGKRSQTT